MTSWCCRAKYFTGLLKYWLVYWLRAANWFEWLILLLISSVFEAKQGHPAKAPRTTKNINWQRQLATPLHNHRLFGTLTKPHGSTKPRLDTNTTKSTTRGVLGLKANCNRIYIIVKQVAPAKSSRQGPQHSLPSEVALNGQWPCTSNDRHPFTKHKDSMQTRNP